MGRRPAAARVHAARICSTALLAALCVSCSIDTAIRSPRSATQQLLQTVAIDRALERLEWPELVGKQVFVDTGAPGDMIDTQYLSVALETLAASEGFQLAASPDEADLELTLLAGAISLDVTGRLFGIRGTGGGLIPFTIPELAIYRRVNTRGMARLRLSLIDPDTRGILFQSGPVEGRTTHNSFTALFVIHWSRSDLPKLDEPDP